MWRLSRNIVLLILIGANWLPAVDSKDLRNALRDRYKGRQLTVMVPGFYAGEYKKDAIGGIRYDFVRWNHIHESLPIRPSKTILDQIDTRTFATSGAGTLTGHDVGSNTFPVEKGENLLVTDVDVAVQRRVVEVRLYLTTLRLSRAAARDPRKSTRAGLFERVGLGCQFVFMFSEELMKTDGTDAITAEITKYLMPSEDAERHLKAETNIELEIGATEADVIRKLGEPVKSVKIGSEKLLRYKDMTVILKDGKVTSVKIE